MVSISQKNRPIQVATPLREDVLLFYRMRGAEKLGELFEYELDLLSEDPAIDPDKLLGENLTVGVVLQNGQRRYFNGYVARFGQREAIGGFAAYRATLRPWLWFLTRRSNCRIFQHKTVPDIVKQLIGDAGFGGYLKESLSLHYAEREYCVQYRETDFDFVSRLLEEEGIYYHFVHENGRHDLVLTDSTHAHSGFPGYGTIPYHPEQGGNDKARADHIHKWTHMREIQPGAYVLRDYDFENPKANLEVRSEMPKRHANAGYERFDYPGRYIKTGTGNHFVSRRMEERCARFEGYEGKSNARGLGVGRLFTLREHPRNSQNREYLVVSAVYRLQMDGYIAGVTPVSEDDLFQCGFTALDAAEHYRPPHKTPKAQVRGVQTAVVVGPAGKEIHTDSHGRVKVQFHWDRYGKNDQNSSCWIRVSHPWAGKNWGTVAIPRIGQEVIVDFLEGDPDRPIITGRVYNAVQKPPYALPGGAHVMGFKSSSTPGGSGHCEMTIHDTAGDEKIILHSQKDMDTTVRNNDTQHVMANRTVFVDGQHDETVKKDMTVTVTEGNQVNIVKAGGIHIEAATSITLKVGSSTLEMDKDGNIKLNGVVVTVVGSGKIDLNP